MTHLYEFCAKEDLPQQSALPDPFEKNDGTRVRTSREWIQHREYLKAMLDHYMFGKVPDPPKTVRGKILSSEPQYDGKALLEKIYLQDESGLFVHVEVIRPTVPGRYPVIVWNQFSNMERCPVEQQVLQRGYAILSFDRTQFAPDEEGTQQFMGGAFQQAYPTYTEARAVAIWAWGCSYCASWLKEQVWADALIVTGFSRGGKTALRAAAWDERFAVCAPVSSGTGGGGCFRYAGGCLGEGIGASESLGWMTRKDRFWYWYRDELAAFGNPNGFGSLGEERRLPFDLHTLRALVAPRAIICTEGLEDDLSSCYGTQITWRAAQEVYKFLGAEGVNALAFFEGGHEFTSERWLAILDFCDVALRDSKQKIRYRRFEQELKPLAHQMNVPEIPALHFQWRAPKQQ
jgi:hypothetical protein